MIRNSVYTTIISIYTKFYQSMVHYFEDIECFSLYIPLIRTPQP